MFDLIDFFDIELNIDLLFELLDLFVVDFEDYQDLLFGLKDQMVVYMEINFFELLDFMVLYWILILLLAFDFVLFLIFVFEVEFEFFILTFFQINLLIYLIFILLNEISL